jgi:hypothetical protein
VEDNNEKLEIVEQEDDAGLDNEDIQLSREQQLELKYKFKTFNAEVDSENPEFKLGMVFSSIQEFAKVMGRPKKFAKVDNEDTLLYLLK